MTDALTTRSDVDGAISNEHPCLCANILMLGVVGVGILIIEQHQLKRESSTV